MVRASMALAAFGVLATSATARAEDGPPATPSGDAVAARGASSYWSTGRPRWFISVQADVGFPYARPHFDLGYGRPHASFVSAQAVPIATVTGIGQFVGLRGALGFVDARVGARYFLAMGRNFLTPRASYDRLDIDERSLHTAHYGSLEADILVTTPRLGPGEVLAHATVMRVIEVPDNVYLFEEALRLVVKPPWIWRARLGYPFVFGPENALRVGPVVEALGSPARGAVCLRAGLLVRATIGPHLDLLATLVPVLASPDNLGLAGGDFATLGLRYRWATGMDDGANSL